MWELPEFMHACGLLLSCHTNAARPPGFSSESVCCTFVEEFDEVQRVLQDDPHRLEDVAPQDPLRLRTHFQTCNDREHTRCVKVTLN